MHKLNTVNIKAKEVKRNFRRTHAAEFFDVIHSDFAFGDYITRIQRSKNRPLKYLKKQKIESECPVFDFKNIVSTKRY